MSYGGLYLYVLDDSGKPVPCEDVLTWGQWFEEEENRQIADDTVGDIRISTVFLGVDHNFSREGPPLLFETMTFSVSRHDKYMALRAEGVDSLAALTAMRADPPVPFDQTIQRRYATKEEALRGHLDTVMLVMQGGCGKWAESQE